MAVKFVLPDGRQHIKIHFTQLLKRMKGLTEVHGNVCMYEPICGPSLKVEL